MPLKRITPSFTVEHRQARRPSSGSAKPGWAHAKPAPAGLDEKANRIAISAFKTVAAKPPADIIAPPIPTGRILPSLVETETVTGQADAEGAQSRSHGSAAKAGHFTQVTADGTGPVCPVVWEGWRREAFPYPDQSPYVSDSRAFGISTRPGSAAGRRTRPLASVACGAKFKETVRKLLALTALRTCAAAEGVLGFFSVRMPAAMISRLLARCRTSQFASPARSRVWGAAV
jgi:hypothetical protein